MTDVKQSSCPVITHDKRATFLDGAKIYSHDEPSDEKANGTEYYPSFIDSFYRTITGSDEQLSTTEDAWYDYYHGSFVGPSRGLCDIVFYSGGERDIRLPNNEPNGFPNETSYTLYKGKLFAADRKTVLVGPDRSSPPIIDNKRRIIIIGEDPVLKDYIGIFTGSIEGFYVLPSAYEAKEGLTISIGPAYGQVLLRTCPDSRFYLSFNRNEKGVLVGEFMRTRLIPLHESKKAGRSKAVLTINNKKCLFIFPTMIPMVADAKLQGRSI